MHELAQPIYSLLSCDGDQAELFYCLYISDAINNFVEPNSW